MKYMGSKSRIAKYIVPILQYEIDANGITEYYEPFVGGANIIDKIRCKNRYGSDSNKYLIALFQHMQNGGSLYETVPRELYNAVRSAWQNGTDQFADWQIGNVGILASYNGKFWGGTPHRVMR